MIKYPANVIVKSFAGMEELLAEEVRMITNKPVNIIKRAIQFRADQVDVYRINYESRFALKVLVEFVDFTCEDEKQLYKNVKEIAWEKWMTLHDTFAVDAVLINSNISHSKYAALKCKDAIVDRFRDKYDQRPNVRREDPDLQIHLHISQNKATISFDSSGDPLFKRGYRKETGPAPLNEIVSAAIIQWSTWNSEKPLIDITCGSGTLLIEAARKAENRPSQELRNNFGFMRWKDFNPSLFTSIKKEAADKIVQKDLLIYGIDIHSGVLESAKENAIAAQVRDKIQFVNMDFKDYMVKHHSGVIVSNPPYGERLTSDNIRKFYNDLGSWLKHSAMGFQALIFSMDNEESKQIGLKPTWKKHLFNGSIPCRLSAFELYAGTKKIPESKTESKP